MLIEQELARVLRPLVSDRAYPVVLPQGAKHPAITFHRLNGGWKSGQINGLLKLIDVTGYQSEFQVVIWSSKYSDVTQLLQPVVGAVESVEGLELDAAVDGYDDALGKRVYSKIIDFTAWDDVRSVSCPASTSVTDNPLKPVTDAIQAAISENFNDAVKLVDLYENQQMNLSVALPAILLEPQVLGKGRQRGDNSYPFRVQFTAYCLVPTGQGQRINAQWLAVQVAQLCDFNHWGLGRNVDNPELTGIDSYTLRPGCNGFECWQAQWEQTVYLVEDEPSTELPPDDVFASVEPELGPDYKPDYQQVTGFTE